MVATAIAGASQGIGRATARLFAERGHQVVLAARTPERLEAVAAEIRERGGEALAVPTDVTDPEQVANWCEKAIATYGQIDVLVNNAGICASGPVANMKRADWQRAIDTNLWGYINTIQALLPHFQARGRGSIVNVGSIGGKMPFPNMTAYCTSKYAVAGLSETLRLELLPQGIQVCAIHPGIVNSDFLDRAIFCGEPDTQRQQMRQAMDSAIASQPEDVAEAIWNAVRHPQAEVTVGPMATVATTFYRLAPGLTQWMLSRAT